MKRIYRYRVTRLRTDDYGEAVHKLASLSMIPDGSHWQDRPPSLEIAAHGLVLGDIVTMTLEVE